MKPLKITVPEELKADMPQTIWGKIFAATPVVMAVISTMLAGLASSEMTKAQYDRSLGAQQQSKAGDQWNFFQAKRHRGAIQNSSLDLLHSIAEVRPLDVAALKQALAQPAGDAKAAQELSALLDSTAGKQALEALQQGRIPGTTVAATALDPNLKAAIQAIENLQPESEITPLVLQINDKVLDDALRGAKELARAFDDASKPVNDAVAQLDKLAARTGAAKTKDASGASFARDLAAARMRYNALRYDAEARLNQNIAGLYELQVRKSNISAERHHRRSQRFFFGMLAAQLGVIVSTVAMAARKRNILWTIAAGAGLIAICFAVYVYLYV